MADTARVGIYDADYRLLWDSGPLSAEGGVVRFDPHYVPEGGMVLVSTPDGDLRPAINVDPPQWISSLGWVLPMPVAPPERWVHDAS